MEVTSLLPASVGDTRETALAALRPGTAFYGEFFPRYNRMMAEQGFAAEAGAIAAAWARGDHEAAERPVSDEMIEQPVWQARRSNTAPGSRPIGS